MWKIISVILVTLVTAEAIYTIRPRPNIWVTWANQTGQNSFCLSLATASDPFRTCLIGVPLDSFEEFKSWTTANPIPSKRDKFCRITTGTKGRTLDICTKSGSYIWHPLGITAWNITRHLNVTGQEPQELELLGSAPGNYCLFLGYQPKTLTEVKEGRPRNESQLISPSDPWYQNRSAYCGGWVKAVRPSKDSSSKQLPPGIFLICGDRAWSGIPSKPLGGPCYLGKLTLFAPSIQQALHITKPIKRQRRSVYQLGSDCRDDVNLWDRPSVIVSSIFAPGVASAKALTQLQRLACWTGKQINITSKILAELMTDVDSVRHAVLQNRAAIDFLLLAQGHGCEDFDGMCCLNLSDHSVSIHKQLSQLHENMKKLTVTDWGLDEWLKSLGLGGWIRTLIMYAIGIVLGVVCLALLLPCLINCLQGMLQKMVQNMWQTSLMVQNENGGNVESFVQDWLQEKGHMEQNLLQLKDLG